MSVTPAPRAATGTFTDLLADAPSHQGVSIDSVFDQHDRDLSRIREPGIDRPASMATRHPLKAGRP